MERLSKFRGMRVDTTVVETNIHYATDSSLLGDEVRVLPRTDRFARPNFALFRTQAIEIIRKG